MMDYKLEGFYLRPALSWKEKVGIALTLGIAVMNSLLIYYLTSIDLAHYSDYLRYLSEWTQGVFSCSSGWVKASFVYQEKMYLIYLQSVVSIMTISAVVFVTTPKEQLTKWAKGVQIKRAAFLLLVHVTGLVVIVCWLGDDLAMRLTSKYAYLFNTYLGISLLVSVGVTAMSYYVALSVLLFKASLEESVNNRKKSLSV